MENAHGSNSNLEKAIIPRTVENPNLIIDSTVKSVNAFVRQFLLEKLNVVPPDIEKVRQEQVLSMGVLELLEAAKYWKIPIPKKNTPLKKMQEAVWKSVWHLQRSSYVTTRCVVRKYNKALFSIDGCDPTITMKDFKRTFYDKFGIPSDQQGKFSFVYAGNEIQDLDTSASLLIGRKEIIDVVVKPSLLK